MSIVAISHDLSCSWSVSEVYTPEYGAPIFGGSHSVAMQSVVHSFAGKLCVEPLCEGVWMTLAFLTALLHFAKIAVHFERLFRCEVVESWLLALLLLVSATSLLGLSAFLLLACDVLLLGQPLATLGAMLFEVFMRSLVIATVGLSVAFATRLVIEGFPCIDIDIG